MQAYLSFDNIFEKLNFSWEGGQAVSEGILRSERGSYPLCSIENNAPDPNSLPLSDWRSVGMWLWNNSKLYIKRRITYWYTYLFKLFTWQLHRNILSIRKIVHPKKKKEKWKQICSRIQVILPKMFEMNINLVYRLIPFIVPKQEMIFFLNVRSFRSDEWLFI